MGDIKLFKLAEEGVAELEGRSVDIEKSLQKLMENNLQALLGVTFVATEHYTGKLHNGRIDTLGIDENKFPVIIEYKRHMNNAVINQGLFYLDWLMDHKGDFEQLVRAKCGHEVAQSIEWSNPRLICIAGDFTRYDEHAIRQIDRNIELIRYRQYEDSLLLLELINSHESQQLLATGQQSTTKTETNSSSGYKTVSDYLGQAPDDLHNLYDDLETFILSLGDDVQKKVLKTYIAYKRIKNFVCVEIHAQEILIFLKVNPDDVALEDGFTRDVRNIGHFGTGDLEVRIADHTDLDRAKSLILMSYEAS